MESKLVDELSQDREPADLREALSSNPAAQVFWLGLTPIARRDYISWIEYAKQAETRERRIQRTCENLIAGKKRPCCFTIMPLDLHLALKANPRAKANWSGLSPDDRRDLIGWIEEGQDKSARKMRIEEACTKLVSN